jgi:hypothetical protein
MLWISILTLRNSFSCEFKFQFYEVKFGSWSSTIMIVTRAKRVGVEIENLIAVESFDCSKILTSLKSLTEEQFIYVDLIELCIFEMNLNSILFLRLPTKNKIKM